MDLHTTLEMESPIDARLVMLEHERVYQFLLGLNLEYDEVCDRVLGKEPFLDLDEAFMLVRGEESRREFMEKKMRIPA